MYPKPSQESVLIPHHLVLPGSWPGSPPQRENVLSLSRSVTANSAQAPGLPGAWPGSLLLPRKLVLARRWPGDWLSPQQLTVRRPVPQSPHVAPSQHPALGPRPHFSCPAAHTWAFHLPCASQLSPMGLPAGAVRDRGSPFDTLESESGTYLWEFF